MRKRSGFTLIELVVVVMILGVLAAVAAPKLLGTTKNAGDAAVKQSLGVVRNAIELFASDHAGALPGADGTQLTFQNDLKTYLRVGSTFPVSQVGPKNNLVRMQTTGAALVGDAVPTMSWAYDNTTGQFIVNSSAVSSDGVTIYQNF